VVSSVAINEPQGFTFALLHGLGFLSAFPFDV
jgi:hypothetical protein